MPFNVPEGSIHTVQVQTHSRAQSDHQIKISKRCSNGLVGHGQLGRHARGLVMESRPSPVALLWSNDKYEGSQGMESTMVSCIQAASRSDWTGGHVHPATVRSLAGSCISHAASPPTLRCHTLHALCYMRLFSLSETAPERHIGSTALTKDCWLTRRSCQNLTDLAHLKIIACLSFLLTHCKIPQPCQPYMSLALPRSEGQKLFGLCTKI